MTSDAERAQRWHDTDHGDDRGAPLRPNQFRIPVDDEQPQWVSSRWFWCERCDPLRNHAGRSNPFWAAAMRAMGEVARPPGP